MYFSASGAVVFTEKDALPSAQLQFSGSNNDGERAAGQGRHYMGGRIALGMAIGIVPRNHSLQHAEQVALHIWIAALVNSQPGSGMRIEKTEKTLSDSGFRDSLLNLRSNIRKLHTILGADRKIAGMHFYFSSLSRQCPLLARHALILIIPARSVPLIIASIVAFLQTLLPMV